MADNAFGHCSAGHASSSGRHSGLLNHEARRGHYKNQTPARGHRTKESGKARRGERKDGRECSPAGACPIALPFRGGTMRILARRLRKYRARLAMRSRLGCRTSRRGRAEPGRYYCAPRLCKNRRLPRVRRVSRFAGTRRLGDRRPAPHESGLLYL